VTFALFAQLVDLGIRARRRGNYSSGVLALGCVATAVEFSTGGASRGGAGVDGAAIIALLERAGLNKGAIKLTLRGQALPSVDRIRKHFRLAWPSLVTLAAARYLQR